MPSLLCCKNSMIVSISVRQVMGMFIAAANTFDMLGVQAHHCPQASTEIGRSKDKHTCMNLLIGSQMLQGVMRKSPPIQLVQVK